MKIMIYIATVVLIFSRITFCQSVITYQTGSGIEIQAGADVCADQININGTFSGGGTICGGTVFLMNLTAFIQGFYNTSTNMMKTDTLRVYLRSSTAPYMIADSSISILDTNGSGIFYFANLNNGVNYYIVLKHRNSIETWSSAGNAFVLNSLIYDFTSAVTKAYGNNQIFVDNAPVRSAIFNGDVNQDGVIDGTDAGLIDNAAAGFATGYIKSDLNGDDFVDGSDAAIADNNAFNFIGRITP